MYNDSYFFPATASPITEKPPQLTLNSNLSSSSSLGFAGTFAQAPASPSYSPGPNFEGSWLDIESEDEDDSISRRTTMMRMRRKNSDASAKNVMPPPSRNPFASFRSTFHLRRLTGKNAR